MKKWIIRCLNISKCTRKDEEDEFIARVERACIWKGYE